MSVHLSFSLALMVQLGKAPDIGAPVRIMTVNEPGMV
jgi:hypothetical protein